MTTESTGPQPEMGPVPANGQGQSQGHRRRRRRRKNKSNQQGGQQPQQGQMQQNQPPQQAPPQMQAPQQPQQGGQQPQKQGAGRHRKKKKFFQQKSGPQPPQPQPGNSIIPQHQGRRKDRQKGPRMFVGPMDHSYRAANGNVADGPPSTIPLSGNGHHSGAYYDVNSGAPSVPVRADAPTRIFCFIDDLFFQAKIQETAKKLGVKVEFVKG
jgi:hypothetical protein